EALALELGRSELKAMKVLAPLEKDMGPTLRAAHHDIVRMACALRSGRRHRANEALAYHVLDVMHAFGDSSQSGAHVQIESSCERPAPMPMNPRAGGIDV
nr:hypothetical protein [Candidatus Hydrogenedentota bacterium]